MFIHLFCPEFYFLVEREKRAEQATAELQTCLSPVVLPGNSLEAAGQAGTSATGVTSADAPECWRSGVLAAARRPSGNQKACEMARRLLTTVFFISPAQTQTLVCWRSRSSSSPRTWPSVTSTGKTNVVKAAQSSPASVGQHFHHVIGWILSVFACWVLFFILLHQVDPSLFLIWCLNSGGNQPACTRVRRRLRRSTNTS